MTFVRAAFKSFLSTLNSKEIFVFGYSLSFLIVHLDLKLAEKNEKSATLISDTPPKRKYRTFVKPDFNFPFLPTRHIHTPLQAKEVSYKILSGTTFLQMTEFSFWLEVEITMTAEI